MSSVRLTSLRGAQNNVLLLIEETIIQDRIVPINISNLIVVFNKNEKPPEHSMVLSEATHIDIKEKAQT